MVGFVKKNGPDLRKNLGYKEFSNGSTIELAYVLTTASNIRGKSADELLFDEAPFLAVRFAVEDYLSFQVGWNNLCAEFP